MRQKNNNEYDFTNGTERVKKALEGYDFVLASLDTPLAGKSQGYSAKKVYNAPDSVTDLLKYLNIKNIATATSHILDKGEKGLETTLKTLSDAGINQVGSGTDSRSKPLILEKDQIKIGVLSYATKSYVKYKNEYSLNLFDEENIKNDMAYLKEQNVDFVIAYLNIPDEDSDIVNSTQKKNVEILFESGVNAVFGTGAMVIQEDDEDEILLGEEKSHIYTVYSLGDFMGSYADESNKLSVIASLEFTKKVEKNPEGDIVNQEKDMKVKNPVGIYTMIDKNYKKEMYILDEEIKLYDAGNSKLTAKEYKNLKDAKEKIEKLYSF